MKSPRSISWNFLFASLLPALLLIIIYGCAPKVYRSSYSDPEYNFRNIEKVAIVLEKENIGPNLLFADIFTQTALEKRKFYLARKQYIPEEKISKLDLRAQADALLKISLTHCYPGFRTESLPTSIGASAELVETATGKMVWNMKYSYSSEAKGDAAPMLVEVMEIVANKMIDSVPLEYTFPTLATPDEYEEPKDILPAVPAPSYVEVPEVEEVEKDYAKEVATQGPEFTALIEEAATEEEKKVVERTITPFESGPYFIHAASVRAARKDAAEKFVARKTSDGSIRLAKLVDLRAKGRWYRLLIGRFKSADDCWSYIRKSKSSGEIDKGARPVKLPFSLLISSKQPLDASQKMVEGLRKKDLTAYLSPPAGSAQTYDVLVGAYESKEEAAKKAKILLKSDVSADIISP